MLDKLSKHSILEYHPDTLTYVRSLYDLGLTGRMDEAIDKLEDWIKKQPYFTKTEYPRDYLERTIISTKGSIERAKMRIDKVCTFRTLAPQLLQEPDIKNFKHIAETFKIVALPKLTKDHYRVFILKLVGNYNSNILQDAYRKYLIFIEYMKAHDYSTGVIYILDYTELNLLSYISCLNPLEFRDITSVAIEGYGVRLKGIHMLTTSKAVETVAGIFKKVLPEKVGSRMAVHKDIESLHNVVAKNILPKDYEGEARSIDELCENWIEVIGTDDFIEYQKEMNKACTIEAKRPKDTKNEETLGMPGTFRTLTVD